MNTNDDQLQLVLDNVDKEAQMSLLRNITKPEVYFMLLERLEDSVKEKIYKDEFSIDILFNKLNKINDANMFKKYFPKIQDKVPKENLYSAYVAGYNRELIAQYLFGHDFEKVLELRIPEVIDLLNINLTNESAFDKILLLRPDMGEKIKKANLSGEIHSKLQYLCSNAFTLGLEDGFKVMNKLPINLLSYFPNYVNNMISPSRKLAELSSMNAISYGKFKLPKNILKNILKSPEYYETFKQLLKERPEYKENHAHEKLKNAYLLNEFLGLVCLNSPNDGVYGILSVFKFHMNHNSESSEHLYNIWKDLKLVIMSSFKELHKKTLLGVECSDDLLFQLNNQGYHNEYLDRVVAKLKDGGAQIEKKNLLKNLDYEVPVSSKENKKLKL